MMLWEGGCAGDCEDVANFEDFEVWTTHDGIDIEGDYCFWNGCGSVSAEGVQLLRIFANWR